MKYVRELAVVLALFEELEIPLHFVDDLGHAGAAQNGRVFMSKEFWGKLSATPKHVADMIGVLLHELCHAIDYYQHRYSLMHELVTAAELTRQLPTLELRADRFARDMCKKLKVPFVSNHYLREYNKRGMAGFRVWVLRHYGFLVVHEKATHS